MVNCLPITRHELVSFLDTYCHTKRPTHLPCPFCIICTGPSMHTHPHVPVRMHLSLCITLLLISTLTTGYPLPPKARENNLFSVEIRKCYHAPIMVIRRQPHDYTCLIPSLYWSRRALGLPNPKPKENADPACVAARPFILMHAKPSSQVVPPPKL